MRKRIKEGAAAESQQEFTKEETKELRDLFSSKEVAKKRGAMKALAGQGQAKKVSREAKRRAKKKFKTLWQQAKQRGVSLAKFIISAEVADELTRGYSQEIIDGILETEKPPKVRPAIKEITPEIEEIPELTVIDEVAEITPDIIQSLHESEILTGEQLVAVSTDNHKKARKISGDIVKRMKAAFRVIWQKSKNEGSSMAEFARAIRKMKEFTEGYVPEIVAGVTEERIAAGEEAAASSPTISPRYPYRQYIATHDDRVRDTHLELEHSGLNGTAIYRADDPVWKLFRPPWQINCRCSFVPLSVVQASRRGVSEAVAWRKRAKEQRKPLHEVAPEHPEHVGFPHYGGSPISPEFF